MIIVLCVVVILPCTSCRKDKNVLLIGDSISIGYTPYVREMLREEASVYRIPGNGQDTWWGLQKLDQWISDTIQWDVIHFNWGLWDIAYRREGAAAYGNRDKVNGTLSTTPEEYRMNLEKLVSRLKETGAALVWCSTTYVPPGEAGRKLGDEIIYNEIAREIIESQDVQINDLHPLSEQIHPQNGKAANDVHFTKEGYQMLADQVATSITELL